MITATKKSKETDYSRIVKDTLGICPGYLLDSIILLYIFGVIISYLVVIYSLIGRVYFELSNNKNKYEEFEGFESEIWDKIYLKLPIMYGLCAILIPICLLKDISKMRFTSLFGIITLLYAIGVVVCQSFSFYSYYKENIYKKDDPSTHPNYYDITPALKPDLKIFSCLATIFFSYTCHIGAFPVYKSLKNNISRRINKVFRRSILLDTFIYISVGVAGFFTAPVDTPQLIIYRKSINKNDIYMSVARIGIALSLIMNTPPNYNSFRISFFEVFFKTNEIDNKKNFFVTIITLVVCTSIAIVYKDILTYISLLGGFCSVVIAFLIPGLIYVKTNKYKLTHYKNILSLMLIITLCTIGWTAGMQSLIFL
jgi:amino acid permease